MSDPLSTSVSIPPDVVASLQRYAESSGRTMADVAEEALRTFLDDEEMTDLRRFHALKAASMGLSLDDYVMALVKEDRRESSTQQAA